MSSEIDATVPADNVKASKALIRENFQIAKDEITALQVAVAIPSKIAFGNDAEFDAV